MAGTQRKKKVVLPVTKTGYQFQSEAELREAYWLIEQGDFKDLDDFGRLMQLGQERMLKEYGISFKERAA